MRSMTEKSIFVVYCHDDDKNVYQRVVVFFSLELWVGWVAMWRDLLQ